MGCYGIGSSRLLGAIAECLSDDRGLRWPSEVAPYKVHLVALTRSAGELEQCAHIYQELSAAGLCVLYDDRHELRPGERLSDADLIGIPDRLVYSPKSLAAGGVEHKSRFDDATRILPLDQLARALA